MRFARYVGERPILVVAIQPGTLALGLVLLAKILAHDVGHRRPVAGYENVGPSIVVVVEEPAGEAHVWLRNAGLPRHVDELRYPATGRRCPTSCASILARRTRPRAPVPGCIATTRMGRSPTYRAKRIWIACY